jgi:hypothetical protein
MSNTNYVVFLPIQKRDLRIKNFVNALAKKLDYLVLTNF